MMCCVFFPIKSPNDQTVSAGDSGNPLMNYVNWRGKTKAVQLGIVTAGHSECGRGASGFPGIYTDINFYMDFILDNLEE